MKKKQIQTVELSHKFHLSNTELWKQATDDLAEELSHQIDQELE
jgi:hypothetical protein